MQTSERRWSDRQLTIFDAIKEPKQNILIQAVAGSGKTTTIVKGMEYAGDRPCFLAFNKSIQLELASRVTVGEVKTLNALGHRMVVTNLRGAELDAKKNQRILAELMGEESEEFKAYAYTLSRLIGLAKSQALPPTDEVMLALDMQDIADNFQMDIPADMLQTLTTWAAKAMVRGFEDLTTFDFDDQLYWPILRRWIFPRFTDVFVDECQDLNTIQHLMLQRLAEQGARIVAVGDRHQAIYGFRGALSDSMDQLRIKFNMQEYPLDVTYRCGTAIVELAQEYCPHILPRPDAPSGTVIHAASDPRLFPPGMLVICRNNAPLFRAVLGHIRAKSPCRVLSNFLESFQTFVKSFRAKSISELLMKLDKWYDKEMEAAKKKRFAGKMFGIQDRYETVRVLAEEFGDVATMLNTVARLAEGTGGPTFSTVHKAKGLEADSVYILRPDLIPASYCESEEQLEQERNLLYVAITRAKTSLTLGARPKPRE